MKILSLLPIFGSGVTALLISVLPAGAQTTRPQDDPAYLKKAALKIDQHIASFYKKQGLSVPEVTDDATFLRRAFLVSIGRIPSAEEALAFLEIEDPDKREQLISYLLASPGYSSHMTNWAFDLLRVRDRVEGKPIDFEPYRNWVRTAIDNDMPWNEMTHQLLASAGDGWDPETAAVGYYTADRGMPLDNVANSMRVFLGSRMECAQCHDDPFGNQTERLDFYELAAFTNGQEPLRRDYMQELYDELNKGKEYATRKFSIAQLMYNKVYGLSLGGGGTGNIHLPEDYQYRGAMPGELVGARTPFGRQVRVSEKRPRDDARKMLAEWVTAKTGDQFSVVIANRMWRRVMGKGIYEPVDSYIPTEDSHYPELVTLVSNLMVEMGYDLRAFQHVLLLTRTFQFATNPNPSVVAGGDDFHGRKIERLSAEQIWDSLITLSDGDPDRKPRRGFDDRIKIDGKPVLVGQKTMTQLSKEVLALKSKKEVTEYYNHLVSLIEEGNPGDGNAGGNAMMSMMSGGELYDKDAMVRASELPSPAPPDHFLSTFGQSNREIVDADTREPNIGQVLSLMNGFVQDKLVNNPNAHLYQSLKDAKTDQDKIRRLYITILSRPPSQEEMGWMMDEVKTRGENGYHNIVAALVMSSEFLFLQ
ncbi:DUF1549 domain-containing protein [Luteolibacter pohnpeiensis]|uniref:DUF1549 domain-containing protein n=1 Tax=Luteolibacter pohnpeiensis TaxID=454153 RepID=A0A934S5R5_9BACT|nr:DUF1549 domain-containing protein [Luteolibacter pohnpeiensis]MBK1881266.1 DUF1549 domain-containing protein [Luteolibacter pohnpeiensis]